MRISDWSSDVCSSDLGIAPAVAAMPPARMRRREGFAGASRASSGLSIDHLEGGPGASLLRGLGGTVTIGATSRSGMVIISVSAGLEVVHRAARPVECRLHRRVPTGDAVWLREAAVTGRASAWGAVVRHDEYSVVAVK